VLLLDAWYRILQKPCYRQLNVVVGCFIRIVLKTIAAVSPMFTQAMRML